MESLFFLVYLERNGRGKIPANYSTVK